MFPINVCAVVKRSAAALLFIMLGVPASLLGETVGVFYNSAAPQGQEAFAAGDVKTALESKGFTVEMKPLSDLNSAYSNKKVVVALESNTSVRSVFEGEGGVMPTGLGEQANALRTTTHALGQKSYWAFGGDTNGAMYGGLQLAENIKFEGFAANYNSQESPAILKRGVKLNLPLDSKSPTYDGKNESTSHQNAISNVWDMSFWTTWFDEMARNRFNVVSVWNMNPFTSLVHLPDYPNVTIQNVTGYNSSGNEVLIKTMTIDEKIAFWKQVMAYAHARGFEFLFFNWNVWLSNANGQYGLANDSTSAANSTYFYKSMLKLLETYPDLDGFGLTKGEHGGTEAFLWNAYGKAMDDYAVTNPARKLRLIVRWFEVDINLVNSLFAPLRSRPNVTLDLSYKYCLAHMYTTTDPGYWTSGDGQTMVNNNYKTWFTIRNDDIYYHNFGDVNFARAYINGLPGQGSYLRGFYMGSDGYSQTRTFFSKNSVTQGTLDIQRQGYMNKLWGRLSYNPNTPDAVFQNYMAVKYPAVSSADLFTAWNKASSGLPKASEIVYGTFQRDYNWWPEACWKANGPYVNITEYANAVPRPNSLLCSISSSAAGSCSGKKSSYQLADEMEADGLAALAIVEGMPAAAANTELGVAVNNIKAMSYLSLYYAYKIRGATYLKAGSANKTAALGSAYCYWMKYANLMDSMYSGMLNQRVGDLQNWHQPDSYVLGDYTSNGGSGTPSCASEPQVSVSATDASASEPSDSGTFTFTRSGATTADLTVNFVVGGTAASGADYQSLGTSVTIAAGQASATKSVTVTDDLTSEGSETVSITLASGAGYSIGSPSVATVTIADNEPPLPAVTVSATDASAGEPSNSGTFTFTRSGSTVGALTVNFTVGGTASGADYSSLGTSVTIADGQASGTQTVTVTDDGTYEGSETVIVTVGSGTGYSIGSPSSATVTIADDEVFVGEALPWVEDFQSQAAGATSDGPPTSWTATPTTGGFRVLAGEMAFNHVGAEGVFTSGVINISSGPVTVSLKVRGGSGLDVGQDYLRFYRKVDGGPEVLIAAADGPQAVATWTGNVPTGSNLVVVVRALVSNSAEYYYFDDLIVSNSAPVGPTVTVTATDASAAEPADNGLFTFTRTGSTVGALTVNFTVGGTASGSDYASLGTSVIIPDGQASATKTVTVTDDTAVESSETVIVTLGSGGYTVGSPSSATVNIVDNDVLPTVTVTASDASAAEPADSGTFTFTRSGGTVGALTVNFAVAGTASGTDYASLGTSVIIPDGQASATAAVTVTDDTTAEGTETVIVTLASSANYTIGTPGNATVNIADDGDVNPVGGDVGTLTGWVSGNTNPKVNGTNRLMTVMVMGESTGDFSATGVTYGGQAMTKQTERLHVNGSRTYAAVFTLNEAGVNAATSGTIAVSWSTTPSAGSSIYSVLLSNADQTTPVSAAANNGLDGTVITTTALTPGSGDLVVVCGATANNNAVTFNNGFVEQFESNSGWGDGTGGSKAGSGASETPSFTQSASGRMVICAIVVKKAGSSGGGLPSPWQTADIGAVAAVGSASYSSPTWIIAGSGVDIMSTADEFRYVHQSASDDCSIVARVASLGNTDPWAKAGVMIRESTAANAINMFVCVTPTNGVAVTWRATTGGVTDNTTAIVTGQAAPKWLRITRTGNAFAASYSNDGTTWTQVGTTQTITMATSVTIGMAVTSHNDGVLCTTTADNVTATP